MQKGATMELLDILKWFASISGIIAAFMVSLDNGRRVTGWGFALFVASSIAWISGALIQGESALLSQNLVLFGINIFGVYRYLIRKKAVDA
jgi:nicotinamide riboside transporter PnuC